MKNVKKNKSANIKKKDLLSLNEKINFFANPRNVSNKSKLNCFLLRACHIDIKWTMQQVNF